MDPVLVDGTRSIVDIVVGDQMECDEWASRLEKLRSRWIQRDGQGFYTLGVAAYIDVNYSPQPEQDYYGRLPTTNGIIRDHFGDLLERVRYQLEALTGRPARFFDGVALPGFHIFEYEAIAVHSNGGAHFDLQYQSVRFPRSIDPTRLLSFTLALRLPRGGGGLDTWDMLPSDAARFERLGRRVDFMQISRIKPIVRHLYTVGTMAVQLRPVLHRIGPIRERYPGDQRMTLQGHGVLDQEGWVLYW